MINSQIVKLQPHLDQLRIQMGEDFQTSYAKKFDQTLIKPTKGLFVCNKLICINSVK